MESKDACEDVIILNTSQFHGFTVATQHCTGMSLVVRFYCQGGSQQNSNLLTIPDTLHMNLPFRRRLSPRACLNESLW